MTDGMFSSMTVESELEKHGFFASTTQGTSMEPLFKTRRDMVILTRPDRELKKYDVALYRAPSGKYVLHRIIAVKKDIYVIRGDNTFVKELVPKNRILGVLIEFNRKGKKHTCNEKWYKIYSVIWNCIYPIRFIIYLFKRICRKCFRTAKKIFGKD